MYKYQRLDEALKVAAIGRHMELPPLAKLVEQETKEDGDYWSFAVKDSGLVVYWGSDTRIVIERKDGKVFESEACFFVRDVPGGDVMDCRKRGVLLDSSLLRTPKKESALMLVKFPRGSVGDVRQVKSLVVKNLDKGVRQK
ncbi:MAG: hypothetical protein QME66_10355 [Candidatus Eisenbacteria bacterium]|nr:hypothetical protein [Candidatus Eisenbacteria bacterium]